MAGTYYVQFKFRTGQSFNCNPESVRVAMINNSKVNQLFIDGVAVANVGRGLPNFDANNDFYLYNGIPTATLYDMMPDDWDKTQKPLKVIDEIFVRTKK